MLNCEACIQAVKMGISPSERTRISSPIGMKLFHPEKPSATDLAIVTERLSVIYEEQGKIMTEVGMNIKNNENSRGTIKVFLL